MKKVRGKRKEENKLRIVNLLLTPQTICYFKSAPHKRLFSVVIIYSKNVGGNYLERKILIFPSHFFKTIIHNSEIIA